MGRGGGVCVCMGETQSRSLVSVTETTTCQILFGDRS